MNPMNFHLSSESFIRFFDKPGNVVLLEGKRKVLAEDEELLFFIGRRLTLESRHMRFRSGNAPGSDFLFSKGVASVDASRLEVIIPYPGHRKGDNLTSQSYALDTISLAEEPEVLYHSKQKKGMSGLVDAYLADGKNSVTVKAAYIIRDTIKVTGTRSGILPATVALFYDDLLNPMQGGTGHTMRVCRDLNIPFLNQSLWMSWLKQSAK